jgi:dinuclear metal center YbgI/SA1388 family protein
VVRVRQIIDWIDSRAPFRYAQSWDNSGLQVGDPEALTDKVMVAIDPGSEVVEEARELGCGCLVTHHPLLLRPIQVVRVDSWPGNVIARSLISGINIVSAHTNLDAALDGTNTQLKDLLGLVVTGPIEAEAGLAGDERYVGMGLVGSLPRALSTAELARQLGRGLGGADVRLTGDPDRLVSRAAVCTGSGGSLIGKVLDLGAEVFITGDIRYHDAKLAVEFGLAIVDVGHFASEKLVLEPLASFLRSKAEYEGAAVEVVISQSEKDPFRIIAGKC